MQELILEENSELTEREQAIKLHEDIITHASLASDHLVEFYKKLKKMKDAKGYLQLGFDKFGDYTSEKLKINERQAYNYISALDNLGEEYIGLNQSYGVSKLALLASVSIEEREELEKLDIESTSVKELQDKIKSMQQQIDMYAEEQSKRADNNGLETSEMAMQRLEEQEAELAAAKRKAAEEARREIETELKTLKEEKEDAIKLMSEFKEKAGAEARSAMTAELEELELEKKQVKIDAETAERLAEERAKREGLEKQLKVSQNPVMTEFKFKLKNLQDEFKTVHSFALNCKEDCGKMCNALKVVMLNLLADINKDEEEEE